MSSPPGMIIRSDNRPESGPRPSDVLRERACCADRVFTALPVELHHPKVVTGLEPATCPLSLVTDRLRPALGANRKAPKCNGASEYSAPKRVKRSNPGLLAGEPISPMSTQSPIASQTSRPELRASLSIPSPPRPHGDHCPCEFRGVQQFPGQMYAGDCIGQGERTLDVLV